MFTEVQDRCDDGAFTRAWALAQSMGSSLWSSTEGRIQLSRIAFNLGAPTFARALDFETYRRAPRDPAAIAEITMWRLEARGPLDAHRWLAERPPSTDCAPAVHARHRASLARTAALLRDFATAHRLLDGAPRGEGCARWVELMRVGVLELEDRVEEALELSRRLLAEGIVRRTAASSVARLLRLLDREDEALAFLVDEERASEAAELTSQLASLQGELHRFDDEWQTLERLEARLPLAEPLVLEGIRARRSTNAHHRGDRALAVRLARECRFPAFEKLAANMADDSRGDRRVRLDVELVRQHHMTCAPATLTSIARYFGRTAEHLQIAEEICYDGTPAHSERAWAERNGFAARELTVSWEAACALLDRGLPFTFTMTETVSAHLVAVIGYDERRGTLSFRDPSAPVVTEGIASEMFEHWAPYGPRGMVLVPKERAAELPALPDEGIYDRVDRFNAALAAHDRARAVSELESLRGVAPEHRLTLTARRTLAFYDQDPREVIAASEQLLALHPADATSELTILEHMREVSTHAERRARLESAARREGADPLFAELLGQNLASDARERTRAKKLLFRSARARPQRGRPLYALGRIALDEGALDEALELHRFAACLDRADETLAAAYFQVARIAGRSDEALAFLEDRFERLGRHGGPTRTLCLALLDLDRHDDAFAVLDRALEQRGEDPELRLAAAELHAQCGREGAAAHLEIARQRSHEAAFARVAAMVHARRGEWAEERAALTESLASDPSSFEVHRILAARIAAAEGRAAAVAHLDATHARFPHHRGIARLRIQWLADHDPDRHEQAVRALIELDPTDAWAHRELALRLADRRELEAALAALDAAGRLRPDEPAQHLIAGSLKARQGRVDEARESFHRAIEASPDHEPAIRALFEAALPLDARVSDVRRVAEIVFARSIDGVGPLAWYQHARAYVAGDELLRMLQAFADQRPELWAAWSLLTRHHCALEKYDEARDVALRAVQRFVAIPRLWVDLAEVHLALGQRDEAIAALDRALAINPTFVAPAVQKAMLLPPEAGRALLEKLVALSPDDPDARIHLARASHAAGDRDAAVSALHRAVALAPDDVRPWTLLHALRVEEGVDGGAIAELREHAKERPWDGAARETLARMQIDSADFDGALGTLDELLALDPSSVVAHELRVAALARAGRLDEAGEACRPPWNGPRPGQLDARAAWLAWQRGQHVDAIAQLRDVLAEHPELRLGFAWLTEWAGTVGNHVLEVQAATRLCEIAPEQASSHAALGDALLSTGDRDGAREAFRRALRLDRGQSFAAARLFDLQLEDSDLEGAEVTLTHLRSDPEAVDPEIRLAIAKGEHARALAAFERSCASATITEQRLERDRAALVLSGLGERVFAILGEALHGEGNAHAGALYMRMLEARRGTFRLADLPIDADGAAARGAITWAVGELLARRELWRLRLMILRAPRALRRHVQDWAQVGRALIDCGHPLLAAAWMHDFATREGVRPWMLWNASLAFRRARLWRRAYLANQVAVKLPPDQTSAKSFVLAAHDDALNRRTREAEAKLAAASDPYLSDYERNLKVMTLAMLEVQKAPERTYLAGRQRLERVCTRTGLRAFDPFTTQWQATARRIARDAAEPAGWAWAFFEWWVSLVLVAIGAYGFASGGDSHYATWLVAGFFGFAVASTALRWGWSRL